LVHEGRFYDSKAISGIAHGIATGQYWTKDDLSGGVTSGAGAKILRDLDFFVDDGELFELTQLEVDRTHGQPAPYPYVVLLWAVSRARSRSERLTPYQEVRDELRELLAPFAIGKTGPDPAMPWFALRNSSWWELQMPSGTASTTVTYADVNSLNLPGGLSASIYARVTDDDAFAGAAVDVISRIIGSEPGYQPLLERLGLAQRTALPTELARPPRLHLLLRWQPVRNTNILEEHHTIAESKGSVWWGKIGDPSRPALSLSNLQAFASQLQGGIPTHVYLYRPGELWRTTLESITTDKNDVDPALVPSYYDDSTTHHLWVKLREFKQLTADRAAQHLTLASNGKPIRFTGQSRPRWSLSSPQRGVGAGS
jgi:hypothetical protein